MRSLICLFTLGLLAPPPAADAQVYPERVRTVTRIREVVQPEPHQRGAAREEQTERLTRTVQIGATGEVDVSNISGDIVVTRGGRDSATIEAIKTARARTPEDAREILKLVQVEINERPGRADVRTRYPRHEELPAAYRRNFGASVEYRITVPEGARVTAKSISGSLSVRDVTGDVALETVSGNIQIANAGRIPTAKTISGNVEITGTTIEGTLGASTVSGTLLLRNVQARRLDLGAISGDVRLEDVQSERIDAQSISGNVHLAGELVKGGRYDLRSHSGEVRVAVSGKTGFELEANSFSGSVRSDLEMTSRSSDTGRRQRALRGTVGDGSAVLSLTTFSGSIVVSRR